MSSKPVFYVVISSEISRDVTLYKTHGCFNNQSPVILYKQTAEPDDPTYPSLLQAWRISWLPTKPEVRHCVCLLSVSFDVLIYFDIQIIASAMVIIQTGVYCSVYSSYELCGKCNTRRFPNKQPKVKNHCSTTLNFCSSFQRVHNVCLEYRVVFHWVYSLRIHRNYYPNRMKENVTIQNVWLRTIVTRILYNLNESLNIIVEII